ncbi:MAG: DEAD/DEAH box helicase, partial [Lachnospiraceae bacterium]|nr:DEAD/DEAH box helicase [Lachnospiraceae bacterium]
NKKKKFYRLKNGDFVNMEGEGIGALMELKAGLNLTDKQLRSDTIRIPKYRALYLDAELKEWQSLRLTKNKAFRALVRNMKTVEDNDYEIPASLRDILREYQKRGFLWLKTLKNNGFGGILADDMGLGKTLQVIAFLLSEQQEEVENRRCLIISPASLVYNWNNEIEKFAPQLSSKMVVGTASERRKIIESIQPGDIMLTSYDLLKRDIEYYQGISFAYQVIDEAQFIKNHNTQAAKAVKMVEADFKLALTGTPVENRLSELWSIFDYLMPGFLYAYQRFRGELETPIVAAQDREAVSRLQKLIRPFVLRRLKKDVLADLPDKLEENVYAKPEGEQQKLYDAHVKRLQLMLDKQTDEEFRTSKIQVLSELTRLRQLCCDPGLLYEDYQGNSAKTDMCLDLIRNAVNGGHKILLFSQFTSMLERLNKQLREEDISFYTLTGATSKEKRKELVEAFNRDDTSVFCISLKAGGTGLNLASADIVIHYDPWWNLAVQNQATDRAHRIGQQNVVTVYKLIVKGSIEENIIRLQDMKKELAEQILGGEGIDQGNFSKEELLQLLRG